MGSVQSHTNIKPLLRKGYLVTKPDGTPAVVPSPTPDESKEVAIRVVSPKTSRTEPQQSQAIGYPKTKNDLRRTKSCTLEPVRSPRKKKTEGVFTPLLSMLTPRFSRSPSQPMLRDDTENTFTSLIMDSMKSCVGKDTYITLYDSRYDDLDSRTFNSRVIGYSNITIVAKTEQDMFGCYHKDTVTPSVDDRSTTLESSDDFFLFSFNTTFHDRIYRKQGNTKTITLYSSNNTSFVLTAFSAFWVLNNGTVNFHPNLRQFYDVSSTLNPFSAFQSKTQELQGLFVYSWV